MGDASRTLVLTVGLSAAPLAFSILTLQPTLVVFVHSESSFTVTERVKRVVEKHCSQDGIEQGEIEAPRDWKYVRIRDDETQSFRAVHHRLGTDCQKGEAQGTLRGVLEEEGVETFRLDYTGGTQVMVSCMVEFHYQWHGDRGDLRSYIGLEDDAIRFDDAVRSAGKSAGISETALYSRLSLTERAELSGYYSHGCGDRTGLEAARTSGMEAGLEPGAFANAVHGWLEDDRDRSNAAIRSLGFPCSVTTSVQEGGPFEVLVAALVHRAATAEGVHGPGDAELMLDATLFDDGHQVVQLDVVCRVGNTVYVYEAKKNTAGLAKDHVVSRVQWAQYVFGPGTATRFVAGEGRQFTGVKTLQDLDNARLLPFDLSESVANVPVLREVKTGPFGCENVEGWEAQHRNRLWSGASSVRPAQSAHLWGGEVLGSARVASPHSCLTDQAAFAIGPIGGSRIAVETGGLIEDGNSTPFRAFGPALTSNQKKSFGLAHVEYRSHASVDFQDYRTIVAAIDAIRDRQPVRWYYITPSTKASTAALTLEALRHDGDLVHVNPNRDIVETRSGAALGWNTRAIVWSDVLRTAMRSESFAACADLDLWHTGIAGRDGAHAKGLGVIRDVAKAIAARLPPASVTTVAKPLVGMVGMPVVLLGGARRAVAFCVVKEGAGPADIRQVLFVTERLFGVAARTIIVMPGSMEPAQMYVALAAEPERERVEFIEVDNDCWRTRYPDSEQQGAWQAVGAGMDEELIQRLTRFICSTDQEQG